MFTFLKKIYLFLERREGREKEKERNTNMREKHHSAASPTPPNWGRFLTRNRTGDLSLCGTMFLTMTHWGTGVTQGTTEPWEQRRARSAGWERASVGLGNQDDGRHNSQENFWIHRSLLLTVSFKATFSGECSVNEWTGPLRPPLGSLFILVRDH